MSESLSITEHDHPAETPVGKRFPRGLRGYRRNIVDDAVASFELRIADLEDQAGQLREELLEAQHVAGEARHDLTRARAELRYWNDRASYVDSEVARARQRAVELEQAARDRADTIEADAQERSLQLVDRVCVEANQIMQAAREEAREMFMRFETDVDMSKQKLDKLEQVRRDVAQTMQGALQQFETAVRELDKVTPTKRLVSDLEPSTRRAVPTFGRRKAQEAARRFDQGVEHAATAALSTPVPKVLTATMPTTDATQAVDSSTILTATMPTTDATQAVDSSTILTATMPTTDAAEAVDSSTILTATMPTTDAAEAAVSPAIPVAASPTVEHDTETQAPPAVEERRSHDADEDFAALMMQP
jgi:vacuolar-type H+-ATPase subunit H